MSAGFATLLEVTVALLLIILNGLLALSELAIVSSRQVRLRTMAQGGQRGAAAALALAANPGRFLSTVQVGITLIGILAGAFSGATLAARLARLLLDIGLSRSLADAVGYGIVIGAITYLSVIIGELVPKHVALRDPERIACAMAPFMAALSRAGGPVVRLLDASTRFVLRLFGRDARPESAVTEEEIKAIAAEAETAGVIETEERRMIGGVLRFGDRSVRGLMTPRTDVDMIDLSESEASIRETLIQANHSILPVVDGDPDDVIGVVQVKELFAAYLSRGTLDIRSELRSAPVVPDTIDALEVLDVLRRAEVPIALVHDEYGHFEGIVTPADALKAIVGAFRADLDTAEPDVVRRPDGSWLLAGSMPADEAAEHLGVSLPDDRDYETVAGLVISELGHLPQTGEAVDVLGWRFEVVDMDGRRVDKVLASRI